MNPKVDTMFLRFDDRLYFQSNRPRLMMEELNQIFENKIREEIRVILDGGGGEGGSEVDGVANGCLWVVWEGLRAGPE